MNNVEKINQVLSKLYPEEVKVEVVNEKVVVTIVADYFTGQSVKNRSKEVLNILQYENKHLFSNLNFEIRAYTPKEKK